MEVVFAFHDKTLHLWQRGGGRGAAPGGGRWWGVVIRGV